MCELDILDEEHINGTCLALQLHLIPSLSLRHALWCIRVHDRATSSGSGTSNVDPYGAFTAKRVSSFKQGMLLMSR